MKELILNLRIFELPTLFEVLQYTFFIKHNLCKHTMAEILENVSIKYNIGQKVVDKFTKLSKKGFSMECFTADFLQFFFRKTSRFGFWVADWVLIIRSKHFRDFLEIS